MEEILERIRSFYRGKWFPLTVFFLTLLGHTSGYDIAFFAMMILATLIGCFVARDIRFAIPVCFSVVFFVTPEHSPNAPDYSNFYIQPLPLTVLIICFGALLIGFIVFAVRNRKTAHDLPWRGVFLTLAVLCVSLLLNGAFNSAYSIKNLLYAMSFPLILLLLFILFSMYLRFTENIFDYFMYCLLLAGTQIFMQLLLAYLLGDVEYVNGSIVKESVVLGWGVWTTVGGMQAFLLPACFYFAATHKYGVAFYLLGFLQFLGTFLSQSRAALLVGGGTLVLCLFAVCFFGKNKKTNRILTLVVLLIGLCGAVLLREKIMALLENFINSGFSDNGRYDLWKLAVEKFIAHPIFGAGFYDSGIVQEWIISVYPYFYHNTILQMLGACGVLGLLAYLFHRVYTIRLCFHKPNLCKSFLGISILSMLMFSMLDVLFFITYPLIFYTLMLLMMEKCTRKYA